MWASSDHPQTMIDEAMRLYCSDGVKLYVSELAPGNSVPDRNL